MQNTNPSSGEPRRIEGELLEVEDPETRQTRIQSLLENLNTSPSSAPPTGPPRFDFGDRSTYQVDPPSELLNRVQSFLPQLASSNAELLARAREDPRSVDIENVRRGEGYIQMNLGLGVFEDRSARPSTAPATEQTTEGSPPRSPRERDSSSSTSTLSSDSDENSESDSGSESDEEEDSDPDNSDSNSDSDSDGFSSLEGSQDSDSDGGSENNNLVETGPRLIRPLPRRARAPEPQRPGIVVLGETDHGGDGEGDDVGRRDADGGVVTSH
ncbi:hypothetical protein JAAARDRAFT_28979 [Jaapia argillacea MUCL 33604]|uniref:Uncharacterized protein n=1 Tax=Jaapia argillacea MUCL 33604 TaxID=933084 RepID=A0A067QK57_9AGAM|nr:hypothetical protein JAAARDRAFT_28979 [Jaapia argillacea MUCL 33604]